MISGGQFTNWNIFFTLFLSLLAMWAFVERKYWLFALAFFVVSWWNFDYSGNGILLMLIFYLCRNKPGVGAALFTAFYMGALWSGYPEDPLALMVGGHAVDWTIFALLALPLILQNLITTSLGFVDTFMVGLLGDYELSAVTAANAPIFLIQVIIFGLMSGLTILVSQYWGKQDIEAINRCMGFAAYTGVCITALAALILFTFPHPGALPGHQQLHPH